MVIAIDNVQADPAAYHQYNVHDFNYGDITWWDRLFGTFKDTKEFAPRCGFRKGREYRLGKMLVFRDVY